MKYNIINTLLGCVPCFLGFDVFAGGTDAIMLSISLLWTPQTKGIFFFHFGFCTKRGWSNHWKCDLGAEWCPVLMNPHPLGQFLKKFLMDLHVCMHSGIVNVLLVICTCLVIISSN